MGAQLHVTMVTKKKTKEQCIYGALCQTVKVVECTSLCIAEFPPNPVYIFI